MDHLAGHLKPATEADKYLGDPHRLRWERLKPVIVQLYTGNYGKDGKSTKIDEVVAFMKRHYSFHAAYVPPLHLPDSTWRWGID